MLPEIALTSQFMDRFTARFGCAPVEWHSALSSPERARAWRAAATGEARVVVGARSALFLPYSELGLIVVDEEHDGGFKQEDRVHYQARDMAVVRGEPRQVPGGPRLRHALDREPRQCPHRAATASVVLPGRYSGAELPDVATIDMRQRPARAAASGSSPTLVAAITETLAKKQQALLFLNRRGYAPLTLCRSCGHRFDCPQCTAWLVEHRYRNRLNCHHCGFSLPLPEKCPKCGEPDVAGRLRARRRAHRRGGGRALPRSAPGAALLRPGAVAHRDARDHQDHRGGRGRHHHRHADGGQGPPLPAARHRRRRRRRPRPRHRPTRARRSAPSSSCTR